VSRMFTDANALGFSVKLDELLRKPDIPRTSLLACRLVGLDSTLFV